MLHPSEEIFLTVLLVLMVSVHDLGTDYCA